MTTQVKNTTTKPRYAVKSSGRGGYRPGAGRPKGSTNKVTLEDLLGHIENHTGISFAEQVAINYAKAIKRADHAGIRDYEKILLGKLVADKQEVTTVNTEEDTVSKAAAFAEALGSLVTVRPQSTKDNKDNK